ncbi:toprim domain-containing protein [Candidatus Giovannonibacteria bacterium]|nr:toprim domain-containing protein [Candidatus Giovannonibacteria bacterium]
MPSPVEEIKQRIDVAELIGSYVRLQKTGANFKGLCPFHNEKTPSFVVSPSRQIWHCFGCSKGGDIFRFIMEIEGHEFPEALKILAEKAGVQIKREDPLIRSERNRLYAIMEEAAKFFEDNLYGETVPSENSLTPPRNKSGLNSAAARPHPEFSSGTVSPHRYLISRGLKDETIKEFRVGFAPAEWRNLLNRLVAKGFKAEEAEKAGLVIKKQESGIRNQGYYDRFRGRIIFPVFDYNGRVIAFGGRIMPGADENSAKYINSPETMLYQKSKVLYGLHKAKTEILKKGECVLVEGYIDALMAWQAGTKNVVASSGTALTQSHLDILRRLCENLIASFDMDSAGADASKRGIEMALANNFNIKIVSLGEAKDPADLVAKDPALWQKAVAEARHIVRFFMDNLLAAHPRGTPELSREFQKAVIPKVASLSTDLEKAHWVGEIAKTLGINEDAVWAALKKVNMGKSSVSGQYSGLRPGAGKSRKELLEDRVLGMLAKSPELFLKSESELKESFFALDKVPIFVEFKKISAGESSGFGAPMQELVSRMALETEIFLETVADMEEEFRRCGRELKKEHLKEKLTGISQMVGKAEAERSKELPKLMEEFRVVSSELLKLN